MNKENKLLIADLEQIKEYLDCKGKDFWALRIGEVMSELNKNTVKLPCNVGDTIYKICPISNFIEFGDMRDGKIVKSECQRCSYQCCECYNMGFQKDARNIVKPVVASDELWILRRKMYFGVVYFLTQQEAEDFIKIKLLNI